MCGRFAQTSDSKTLVELFGLIASVHVEPRYNLAPTQPILTVRATRSGNIAQHMRWGLVPPWAKDLSGGSKLINARAETVFEKRSFSKPARHQRCIVPADGFYEWRKTQEGRTPTLFRPTLNAPFAFAGLWSRWVNPDGEVVYTATILTTAANNTMKPFHHRMPVLLTGKNMAIWLDERLTDPHRLVPLLKPSDDNAISSQPVSNRVNSVRNDDQRCWSKPVDPTNQTQC